MLDSHVVDFPFTVAIAIQIALGSLDGLRLQIQIAVKESVLAIDL
jgi:hypothetical protein